MSVEFAEGAADLGTLSFRIGTTGLQMKRGSEFVADVAVGEASQIVFPVHDCLEEFGVVTSQGIKGRAGPSAASFLRVVTRSRSRLASVGSSTTASAFR